MTSTSATAAGFSSASIVHRGESAAGPFMLTLCRLVEPVSIRPPQSPHLRPYTFFTSRALQRDGSAVLHLHMGFFDTLAYAERWARAVRGRHPDATVTITPPAFWLLPDSDARESADTREASGDDRHLAPVDPESLSDTQVLRMLEARHPAQAPDDGRDQGSEHVELLRPEDTGTRRALREAVVQGARVAFAVQLHWSARPIDPGSVPSLDVLKAYTLYVVENRRASRSCFFLRLGFFEDPLSAKQVASSLQSSFASAAVVPVLDDEIERARAACMDVLTIPCLVQQRLDQTFESNGEAARTTASIPESGLRRGASQGAETLEQTLAQLAERELWSDPDLLSDTGVRHLKIVVEKPGSGRGSGRGH